MVKQLSKFFLVSLVLANSTNAVATGAFNPSTAINTFSSGTEGWEPSTSVVDEALQISATGKKGAGGRLLAYNRSDAWAGVANASLTGVEMDLKYISYTPAVVDGSADLSIRIGVSNDLGGSGTWFVSNNAYTLSAAGNGWEHAIFSFSDLVQLNGTATLTEVLGDIKEVRILHSASANFRGDKVNGAFAVDNISTVPVPAAVWLFVSGLGLLGLRRREA